MNGPSLILEINGSRILCLRKCLSRSNVVNLIFLWLNARRTTSCLDFLVYSLRPLLESIFRFPALDHEEPATLPFTCDVDNSAFRHFVADFTGNAVVEIGCGVRVIKYA